MLFRMYFCLKKGKWLYYNIYGKRESRNQLYYNYLNTNNSSKKILDVSKSKKFINQTFDHSLKPKNNDKLIKPIEEIKNNNKFVNKNRHKKMNTGLKKNLLKDFNNKGFDKKEKPNLKKYYFKDDEQK